MDTDTHIAQPVAILVAGVVVLYFIYHLTTPRNQFWESTPWVGKKNEWFATTRASLRSIKSMQVMAEDGYERFSKFNKHFIIPNFARRPLVMLPPSQIQNVINQPDSILNATIPQHEQIFTNYAFDDPHLMANLVHADIVRRQLTRNLGHLTADINEELGLAFNDIWGADTENWVEVNIWETCIRIISQAANRIFVGAPLCRNQEFLELCRDYSQGTFKNGFLIGRIPKVLRPILAPLVSRSNKKLPPRAQKFTQPLLEDRLKNLQRKKEDPSFKWDPPRDYITWQIEESYAQNMPVERSPEMVNMRILMTNMVAIHTSTITIVNTLLNLYSTDPSLSYPTQLASECRSILNANNNTWTKLGLNQMLRIDSAIRESLRYSSLGVIAFEREVASPEGLDIGNGIKVPKGTRIGLPMSSIHSDERLYENAESYDPLRFSRPREEYEDSLKALERGEGKVGNGDVKMHGHGREGDKGKRDMKKTLDLKNTSAVTPGEGFLSFGHGRHACPGRFFATNEIKLMLAFIVQNYEVQHFRERPKNAWMLGAAIPSTTASFKVRKRKVTL